MLQPLCGDAKFWLKGRRSARKAWLECECPAWLALMLRSLGYRRSHIKLSIRKRIRAHLDSHKCYHGRCVECCDSIRAIFPIDDVLKRFDAKTNTPE